MPLRKSNTRYFYRTLFAGETERITLLKRDPDMRASVVTSYLIFNSHWGPITKTGESHGSDVLAHHKRVVFIPRAEITRVGISYINPLDRLVDIQGRFWQPEGTTVIIAKLWENYLEIHTLRTDPIDLPIQYERVI